MRLIIKSLALIIIIFISSCQSEERIKIIERAKYLSEYYGIEVYPGDTVIATSVVRASVTLRGAKHAYETYHVLLKNGEHLEGQVLSLAKEGDSVIYVPQLNPNRFWEDKYRIRIIPR